jgi:hypothetical protein
VWPSFSSSHNLHLFALKNSHVRYLTSPRPSRLTNVRARHATGIGVRQRLDRRCRMRSSMNAVR